MQTRLNLGWLNRPQAAVVAALLLASLASLGMLAARWAYSGAPAYRFLAWNLVLAWVPLVCVWPLRRLGAGRKSSWAAALCAGVWLLFFPNAPYIVTDLLHLRVAGNTLFWFDLIMLLSFAWTGCFLGFASLYAMQRWVERRYGRWLAWALLLLMAGVSGFGIYIGRFLRWNSWDLLFQPGEVLLDIWVRLRHPFTYSQTFAFSIAFAAFFVCAYLLVTAFAGLRRETGPNMTP